MNDNLSLVREIQTAYPQISVGGSIALYLYGITLSRFKTDKKGDLDLIASHFEDFKKIQNFTIKEQEDDRDRSGWDFHKKFLVFETNNKIDLRISEEDPQPEVLEYEGFKYKVRSLEEIIEAKCRYSLKSSDPNNKHRSDIREMLRIK